MTHCVKISLINANYVFKSLDEEEESGLIVTVLTLEPVGEGPARDPLTLA